MRSGFKDQRQRNLAAFRHQDIVGTACGLIVHAFDADAARCQRCGQARMNEALACTRTENDDIRRDCIDLFEMRGSQSIERCDRPRDRCHLGQDKQAVLERDQIDFNPGFIVSGNGLVLLGSGAVKLHDGRGRIANAYFRQLEDKERLL